jgi:hypothetical protein
VDRDASERRGLAADTSEQVRAILEAAERSAVDMRAEAQEYVARVRQAAAELRALLDEGLARFDEQVGSVESAPEEEDFAAAAPAVVDDVEAPPADGDEAGARLIALNMALEGKPREETGRYLAEHFSLSDPEALLDDVYARAGK